MKKKIIFYNLLFSAALLFQASARESIGVAPSGNSNNKYFSTMAGGCKPPSARTDLDINNVRATILNGGDMWWNLVSAKYEVPKVTDPNGVRKNSIFAGALWIGGVDAGNNLKLAAMTYRQNGIDFFAGPLDTTNANIDASRCENYDKIYKVNREDIDKFIKVGPSGGIPKGILDWPGNGNINYGESWSLAPYIDVNADGKYNPYDGDYPNVPGDQALWFVYNDKGNLHTETQGVPIGLELQTTCFAFTTNDEINNMTFYTTKITNFGESVSKTYFGEWCDPDLGNYADDYVGCDTTRSLGYCYNGDDNDEGILGYGLNPPTVGIDFFKGPKNENDSELGMTIFMYYNNDFTNVGNPYRPAHFYNFLQGKWHDGTPVTSDKCNGVGGSVPTKYMFSGDPALGQGWTEKGCGNPPADRRFMQSSGPFTLKTGAVNEVTVGVVWARTTVGGATGSLNLLKLADDKAQTLFDNNFKLIDGPSAPDLVIKEYENQLVFSLEDIVVDNTTIETVKNIEKYSFKQKNPTQGVSPDSFQYKFQGYQIFQIKTGEFTSEFDNSDKVRLVAQVDLKDNCVQVINREFDPIVNAYIPKQKVYGNNNGVLHTFAIKDDLFANGDKNLVNYKTYYYLILAYANIINDPKSNNPIQYLAGRKNVKVISAMPHKPIGYNPTAVYGSGPKIKQIAGIGNGGNSLELTQESIDIIMRDGKVNQPEYMGGQSPINVKVVDATKVKNYQFELYLSDSDAVGHASTKKDSISGTWGRWVLVNQTTHDTDRSDTNLATLNEQILEKYGISITIKQTNPPGCTIDEQDKKTGYLESSIVFKNNSNKWLTGVADEDGGGVYNWIRAGVAGQNNGWGTPPQGANFLYNYDFPKTNGQLLEAIDPLENYEKICSKKIGPYRLCSRAMRDPVTGQVTFGPAYEKSNILDGIENRLEDLSGIDLVFTPDKSKWTKCVVIEMCEDANLSEGHRAKFNMRAHPSWTGEWNSDGSAKYDPVDSGMSWFPGYAINVETGERLNIMFGEDSFHASDNGGDMIWNPNSSFFGRHNVYVCGSIQSKKIVPTIYDMGKTYQTAFKAAALVSATAADPIIRGVTSQIMWVTMPYLSPDSKLDPQTIIPADGEVKFRIRMIRPYAKFNSAWNYIGYPRYTFGTGDLATTGEEKDIVKSQLDFINVVPNPYYGSSGYENSQLETKTMITNLPQKCTIRIYSLNGTLIRTIRKDDPYTFVQWEMKNEANVPISSGMYLIHIDAYNGNEKTLKWFAVMRPIDLDTF